MPERCVRWLSHKYERLIYLMFKGEAKRKWRSWGDEKVPVFSIVLWIDIFSIRFPLATTDAWPISYDLYEIMVKICRWIELKLFKTSLRRNVIVLLIVVIRFTRWELDDWSWRSHQIRSTISKGQVWFELWIRFNTRYVFSTEFL